MNSRNWEPQLARLLAAGAEIEVADPDGTTRRWPLARHHRLEDECLWLRPLTADPHPGPPPQFDHDRAARRGLTWTDIHASDDQVIFHTPSGQTVTVRPIGDDLAARLAAWDTFLQVVVDAATETDLDRLEEDSW